jgi:transcriptional regulator with XRE-family HTH domain
MSQILANNIRIVRNKLKKSQKEFSEMLGFDNNQTVSNWENDKSEPDIKTLKKISELGNVSIDWLMGVKVTGDSNSNTP